MRRSSVSPAEAMVSVRGMTLMLILFGIAVGATIIIGGDRRWTGPAYATALTLPGAPESWGVIIICCALAGLVGYVTKRVTLIALGLFLIAVWSIFFGLSFINEFLNNDKVSFMGGTLFGFLALVYLHHSVLYWRTRA